MLGPIRWRISGNVTPRIRRKLCAMRPAHLLPRTPPRTPPRLIQARQAAQQSGTKIAISFSDPGIIAHFGDGVKAIMGDKVDLVFCNKDEALSFANADTISDAIEAIKQVANEFVITLGAKGALIYDGDELIAIDGVEVEAVDTNGAGDMFAGAYLYGITHAMTHEDAGEFASLAAAKVVSQYGPRLSAEDYRALVKEFS